MNITSLFVCVQMLSSVAGICSLIQQRLAINSWLCTLLVVKPSSVLVFSLGHGEFLFKSKDRGTHRGDPAGHVSI